MHVWGRGGRGRRAVHMHRQRGAGVCMGGGGGQGVAQAEQVDVYVWRCEEVTSDGVGGVERTSGVILCHPSLYTCTHMLTHT